MMWWRVLIALCCTALLAVLPAQSQLIGEGIWRTVPAAGFQGLGDIVSGAKVAYGTQAYSAATRGNAAINACNAGDVNCVDMSTSATTGKLVLTLVGSTDCTVSTCTVKIVYDQSGANQCSSAPCNLTSIGGSTNRAVLTANALGGTACLTFSAASTQAYQTSVSGPTVAQIYSSAGVAERTGAFTSQGTVFGSSGGVSWGFNNAANQLYFYSGGASSGTATASDSAFHAMQVVGNGTSSTYYVDGTNTNSSVNGTSSFSGNVLLGTDGSGDDLTGVWCETAFWGADNTSSRASLNTNMHSANRWNF